MTTNPFRRPIGIATLLGALAFAGAMGASESAEPRPTEDHTYPLAAYSALGSTMAQNSHLNELGWDEKQIEAFVAGVQAAFHGHAFAFDQNTKQLSDDLDREIHELERHRRREELSSPTGLAQFMKDMRKKASMRQTDSGMCYKLMASGGGSVRPRPQDTVVLSFQCMTADDMVPVPHTGADRLRVRVGDLLPGLAEGVQMMSAEGRAIFLLPPALSYGDGEWPAGVDKGMPLAFVVTLHEIESAGTTK